MNELGALAGWIDTALSRVLEDLVRSRSILADAMARLFSTFNALRDQLAEERKLYEITLAEVNGSGNDAGLVGVLREVLGKFVEDIVQISASSVKIMMEVEALRGHTDTVAARGKQIEQIASTTRMLSLNARIEAQRIGSAGAVFRVVADEIKGLAHQSGELSKTIRDALAVQSASLAKASVAVSRLAAADLDHAVESQRNLDSTIVRLSDMSASSLAILSRIQAEADTAIQALQFEDMLTQLLHAVSDKISVVQNACRTGKLEDVAELDARISRDAVTQQSLGAGGVELF
jgi:methyl-accepting chemotaxis protein